MDFSTALDILKRRRWLIAYVVLFGFVVATVLFRMAPRQYFATSQVLAVSSHAGAAPVATSIDLQTLATSSNVMEGLRRDLQVNTPISVLQTQITAHVNFGSNVMPIVFTDRSPRRAVKGANAAAVELSKYYREIAASRFSVVSGYLQKELAKKRAEIQQVDTRLQEATIKDPYNADSDAAQALAQQILSLQQQRDSLQADLIGDEAQAAAQTRHLTEIAPVIHEEKTSSDPVYQKLRAQESADEAQLAIVRSQYKGTYPGLANLEAQVAQEKSRLAVAEQAAMTSPSSISPTYAAALSAKGTIDAKLAADRAHLSVIDSQMSQTEDHLQAVPHMGVKLGDLRRQRDLLVTEYEALAARYTDALATTAQEADVGSITVVDRAQSAAQTLDKRSMLAIFGSLAGFIIIAFGLAFLLEVMDPRIRTLAGVEGLYGRPVLGTISTD
jgi:uncharacterized protein involved in exopolysaccharide biosynthesis